MLFKKAFFHPIQCVTTQPTVADVYTETTAAFRIRLTLAILEVDSITEVTRCT
jgi:hypothetical protein